VAFLCVLSGDEARANFSHDEALKFDRNFTDPEFAQALWKIVKLHIE
jgi:hypothetical protein